MSLSFLTLIEIILFNLALFFFFQPKFIFDFFNISEYRIKKIKIFMLGLGIITLCLLFAWSFYFGAKLVIYKNSIAG